MAEAKLRVEKGLLLTDQWVLKIQAEFVLRKDYQPKLVTCQHCNGHGHFGGGPLGGEPEDCVWCCGIGKRRDISHITEPKPEVPPALVEHMREAFAQYLKEIQ